MAEGGYLSIKGAAASLGLTPNRIRQCLTESRFPGAVRTLEGWQIPISDLEAYRGRKNKKKTKTEAA
jgi:hypothetical protein